MPSKSEAQRRFMSAAAHNPAFAKKAGIPVSVAEEFHEADAGKSYGAGMHKGEPGHEGRAAYGRQRIASALRGR